MFLLFSATLETTDLSFTRLDFFFFPPTKEHETVTILDVVFSGRKQQRQGEAENYQCVRKCNIKPEIKSMNPSEHLRAWACFFLSLTHSMPCLCSSLLMLLPSTPTRTPLCASFFPLSTLLLASLFPHYNNTESTVLLHFFYFFLSPPQHGTKKPKSKRTNIKARLTTRWNLFSFCKCFFVIILVPVRGKNLIPISISFSLLFSLRRAFFFRLLSRSAVHQLLSARYTSRMPEVVRCA